MGEQELTLEGETIRLGDLLKVALGISGGDAKQAIQAGEVKVNGEVDTRRGRRLRAGDRVEVAAVDGAEAETVIVRAGGEG